MDDPSNTLLAVDVPSEQPPAPLPPALLRRVCDPAGLPFETTREIDGDVEIPGQQRALDALQLGLSMRKHGFNVFAIGPTGSGKEELVRRLARERAGATETPPAWCYVHNFEAPRRPQVLRLPAGRARPLARAMDRLIEDLRAAIPAAFDSERYRARKQQLESAHKDRGEKALEELRQRAATHAVAVLKTPTGVSIAPLVNDIVVPAESFANLPADEQARMVEAMELVGGWLHELSAQLPIWIKELREKLRALDHEVVLEAVKVHLDPIRAAHHDLPDVLSYLDRVQTDITENAAELLGQETAMLPPALRPLHGQGFSRRYQVNVLVDPPEGGGAPVVVDDATTYAGLFGHYGYHTELGTAVTDFSMIEPGALHRANGGTLVLDVRRLLGQPLAWEELKRCLRSRDVRIVSLPQRLGLSTSFALEPEPIPLDVKVVLLGERQLYYLMAELDPELLELFKIAADFEDAMARTPAGEQAYARFVGAVARARSARPLDRDALALAIEEAARRAGDAGRLSLHVESLGNLLDEADHRAEAEHRDIVGAADLRAALEARERRSGRVRDHMLEELRRGTQLIDTRGERVGQVNGLTVMRLGELTFGHPARITARVHLGDGQVVDIEREVELGGPIHSKGVLILSGFLAGRYALRRPLSLAASLVFEQSYSSVEGDSASAGELVALLSALGEVPVSQALAITGSVNQMGMVQAVGGVNQKIEGFFDACRIAGGPVRGQGVVIPASNVQHLMLRDDVIEAARQGRFAIVPVRTIDEALAVLTGLPAGERGPDGRFPAGTVNALIERRLVRFAQWSARRRKRSPSRTTYSLPSR